MKDLVKNCSIIYPPKGQAGEYAPLACNPYRGCDHACQYCYVPKVLRMSRKEFVTPKPRKNFINNLIKDAKKYKMAGITDQVLLSFTTDPYHKLDEELQLTRQTIEILKFYGLSFCTLTKGGSRALRDIDLFRPDRDAFASTLTSLDPAISLKWEPGAALPQDRLETLELFHSESIFTWVSLEPVYDTEATLEIIRQSHSFVNLYKIGRINYHRLTKEIDWREFTSQVLALTSKLNAICYIKKDLQPFLPKEYKNFKRRIQDNSPIAA